MKTKVASPNRSAGYALLLVMVMCAVSLIIMAGIMYRTSTVSRLNDRNNKFALCNTVAGAATEKVFARMAYDFQNYGLGQVTNNLGMYRAYVPTAAENAYWGKFVFSDTAGNSNSIFVDYVTNYVGPLPSQYTNLATTLAPVYRIVANVSLADQPDIVGTCQEDVLLSLVPITTYAIFYNGPLEFTKCADMIVRGRTHANDIICVGTSATLKFQGVVTSTKTVGGPKRDGWTPSPWNQNTTFSAGYVTNVPTVTVAMCMTNSHAIIDIPPDAESAASAQGMVRVYNQAHVQIVVSNLPAVGTNQPTQISVKLQNSYNGMLPARDPSPQSFSFIFTNSTKITNPTPANVSAMFTNPPYGIGSFLTLSKTFSDKREGQVNMYVSEIDIAGYSAWLQTNKYIIGGGGVSGKFSSDAPPTILYVADRRNIGSTKLSVVRLVNGRQLPLNGGRGFSVATPNPLYVKGNYNVTADGTHYALLPDSTTNAGTCVPAALLCDAITILSSSFNDATSATTTGNASNSNVVNAAIITGNVPTTGTTETTFSGGVHNLMRMLEDWTNDKLILNTSIVVLYASEMADTQFRNPIGWTPAPINPYYKPPTRQWGFDPNFYDPAKQPPGVPSALVPIRFNWAQPPPAAH